MQLILIHWYRVLQPCWTCLLVLIVFLVISLEFSKYRLMSSTNRNSLASSFWICFLSFSCLFVLPRSSSACWIKVARVDIFVLFLILGRRLSIFHLNMMLAMVIHRCPLSGWRNSVLFLVCWVFFFHERVLLNAFSVSVEMIMFFSHILSYIDCLSCVELTLYCWNKSHLFVVYHPFDTLLDSVCFTLLKIFRSVFIGNWCIAFFSWGIFGLHGVN